MTKLSRKKIKIELNEYNYTCSDGCCSYYGTVTKIDDIELPCHNQNVGTIVSQVLSYLGYEVELSETYNDN